MKWHISYYDNKLIKWINTMPVGMRAYYARITERMLIHGPNLGMPFTKAMGEGLFEIRLKSKEGISRIFYCTLKERRIVMLHGFIKKSQQTPKKDLQLARARMKELNK